MLWKNRHYKCLRLFQAHIQHARHCALDFGVFMIFKLELFQLVPITIFQMFRQSSICYTTCLQILNIIICHCIYIHTSFLYTQIECRRFDYFMPSRTKKCVETSCRSIKSEKYLLVEQNFISSRSAIQQISSTHYIFPPPCFLLQTTF